MFQGLSLQSQERVPRALSLNYTIRIRCRIHLPTSPRLTSPNPTNEAMRKALCFSTVGIVFSLISYPADSLAQDNPFLPPGAKSTRPSQPVVRPAPPAPPPKPINPNLELRGFFRYRDIWHFSVHDKVKNKGFWVTEGDGLTESGIEIESFDEETEVLKLKGGMTLALRESANKTLPVPGQGKPKPISKKNMTLEEIQEWQKKIDEEWIVDNNSEEKDG